MTDTKYADDDPFVAPATGGNLKALKGKALLVYGLETGKARSKFPTKNGDPMVDVITCRVIVLDENREISRLKIMSASMFNQIAPFVGTDRPVLGRLDKQEFDMGEGWVLDDETVTDADMQAARAWIAAHPIVKPADPFAKAAKPTA